jgi:hypothetical protein
LIVTVPHKLRCWCCILFPWLINYHSFCFYSLHIFFTSTWLPSSHSLIALHNLCPQYQKCFWSWYKRNLLLIPKFSLILNRMLCGQSTTADSLIFDWFIPFRNILCHSKYTAKWIPLFSLCTTLCYFKHFCLCFTCHTKNVIVCFSLLLNHCQLCHWLLCYVSLAGRLSYHAKMNLHERQCQVNTYNI